MSLSRLPDIAVVACRSDDVRLLRQALASCDVNAKDHEGSTLLMIASFDARVLHVRLLLDRGADPNLTDNEGGFALLNACMTSSTAARRRAAHVGRLLCHHGAHRDHQGPTSIPPRAFAEFMRPAAAWEHEVRLSLPPAGSAEDAWMQEARPEERGPLWAALRHASRVMDELSTALDAGLPGPPREEMDAAALFPRGGKAWCYYVLILGKPHRRLYGVAPEGLLPRPDANVVDECIASRLVCAKCFVAGGTGHQLHLQDCGVCHAVAFCSTDCESDHRAVCGKKKAVELASRLCASIGCGKFGAKSRCNRCKAVWYCDRNCQRTHWSTGGHKRNCTPPPNAAATATAAAAITPLVRDAAAAAAPLSSVSAEPHAGGEEAPKSAAVSLPQAIAVESAVAASPRSPQVHEAPAVIAESSTGSQPSPPPAVASPPPPTAGDLLNEFVEIYGLVTRADLNGQGGVAYEFDAATGRYCVLVAGERVKVRKTNLRQQVAQLSETARRRVVENPYVPFTGTVDGSLLVRHCANYDCGTLGMVIGAKSPKEARRAHHKVLELCSACLEVCYCSKECQTAHWKWHKQICKHARRMRTILKFFSKTTAINRILCGIADEYAGGTDKRRLIMFKCKDEATLAKLDDIGALQDGLPVDIQYTSVGDLRIQVAALAKHPGDNTIWESVLDQTVHYDLATHISLVVCVPHKSGENSVRPMLIPRLHDVPSTSPGGPAANAASANAAADAAAVSVPTDSAALPPASEIEAEAEASAPDEYRCPLTLELMVDPVVAMDGNTYERSAITEWFSVQSPTTSPLTREEIQPVLVPNLAIRKLISAHRQANGTKITA